MKSIYVFKCGCELPKEEILFYSGARRCPNHRDFGIKEIKRVCVDCGECFTIKPLQTTQLRCNKCRAEYKKTIGKKRYQKKKRKKVEQKMDLSLYTQGLARYLQ